MSSSTALLPKDDDSKDEHPIFLRVCHSPWTTIGQGQLVFVRMLIATYMVVSASYIVDYDLNKNQRGWETVFDFANIVYGAQTVYHVLAFVWTYMHLHYPYGSQDEQDHNNQSALHKLFSPPKQTENSKKQDYFSMFYVANVVFPFTVSFIYWAIQVPQKESLIPIDETFGNGHDTEFFVVSKYIVNSVIAFTELYFLSSVKRQQSVKNHAAGLSLLSAAYIAWGYIGYVATDKYSYFFFDHKKLGWEYVTGSLASFVALSNALYAVVYGLTGLREKSTTKCDNQTYQTLPQ